MRSIECTAECTADPIVHFDEQSLLLRKCSGEAFFCRTDPTCLTAFCAIVLVVCRKYCTFAGER